MQLCTAVLHKKRNNVRASELLHPQRPESLDCCKFMASLSPQQVCQAVISPSAAGALQVVGHQTMDSWHVVLLHLSHAGELAAFWHLSGAKVNLKRGMPSAASCWMEERAVWYIGSERCLVQLDGPGHCHARTKVGESNLDELLRVQGSVVISLANEFPL